MKTTKRDKMFRVGMVSMVLAFSFMAAGCSKNETTQTSGPTPSDIIEIEAKVLDDEYIANQLRADGMYKGKTLQITGRIDSDGVSQFLNEYYLQITGTSGYADVWVYFRPDEINKLANVTKGQAVTIVGKCEGYSGVVCIRDAYLVR